MIAWKLWYVIYMRLCDLYWYLVRGMSFQTQIDLFCAIHYKLIISVIILWLVNGLLLVRNSIMFDKMESSNICRLCYKYALQENKFPLCKNGNNFVNDFACYSVKLAYNSSIRLSVWLCDDLACYSVWHKVLPPNVSLLCNKYGDLENDFFFLVKNWLEFNDNVLW